MPPKKKKAGGKKKAAETPAEPPRPLVVVDSSLDPNWSLLELKLRNWSFPGVDFRIKMRVDTPVYVIKQKIVERHGRMSSLTLYKDMDNADAEITNDRLTLEEIGIEGNPADQEPEHVVIFYDFTPYAFDEPLLLAEHRFSEAALKKATGGGGGD